jgi:hypothetical protein
VIRRACSPNQSTSWLALSAAFAAIVVPSTATVDNRPIPARAHNRNTCANTPANASP